MNIQIKLNLYSEFARTLLSNFFAMEAKRDKYHKYGWASSYKGKGRSFNPDRNKFELAPDGEVILDTDGWNFWTDHASDPAKCREHLAHLLKQSVIEHSTSDGVWTRLNRNVYSHLNCEYRECYAVYDILMGRPNLTRKYDKELLEKVLGSKKNPLETELEIARREEKQKIEHAYQLEIDEITTEMNAKITAFRQQALKERDEKLKDAERRKVESLENLKNMTTFSQDAAFLEALAG